MKNPQTVAENLAKVFPNPKLKAIGDFACCCFTLMWYLGIDQSDADAIITVGNLIDQKALDGECTVYWFPVVKALTGRELESVTEEKITSIKKIKGKAIVKYMNGTQPHWVGVLNGKIVFNSRVYSKTIEQGKPVLIKVLKFKGVAKV